MGPKKKHVDIPDGWYLVTEGVCIKGDMFINPHNFIIYNTEEFDYGIDADTFEALIRKK